MTTEPARLFLSFSLENKSYITQEGSAHQASTLMMPCHPLRSAQSHSPLGFILAKSGQVSVQSAALLHGQLQ